MTEFDIRTSIVPFAPEHLAGVMRLCADERWEALAADPRRTARVLAAPGVTTVVALDREGLVLGFAEVFSDGEIQAYLSAVAVAPSVRRQGLARALVLEAFRSAGGERLDLLSADDAIPFYESFDHQRKPGFRVNPPIDTVPR